MEAGCPEKLIARCARRAIIAEQDRLNSNLVTCILPCMKSVQVQYEGRVQGVGFRWTVRNMACGFDVAGHVKNLPDGRVELLAQGEETDEFLEAIRTSEIAGHIGKECLSEVPRIPGLRGFSIIP